MTLEVLKPSRHVPKPGDIFALKLKQLDCFHFGRVVATDSRLGGFEDVILIYIYKATSKVLTEIPLLSVGDLVTPPIGTNEALWTKGYFIHVQRHVLGPLDVLPKHCFRKPRHDGYVDEYGNPVEGCTGPVGVYLLSGPGGISSDLNEALGQTVDE